jgi:MinD-like ATPase involved in chromosome partitioning or flagellar assembly
VSGAARVTVVAGVGGGAGASTLASALAHAAGGAWLIDLDHDRGDLAPSWDLVGDRTTEDLLPVADELAAVHLRHAGRRHRSGATVVAAPARPGAGVEWSPRATAALVAAARDAAGPSGAVVVDAGAGVPADGSAGDALLLVCPPTLCGARRAAAALEVLRQRRDDRGCGLVVGARPGRAEVGARALARLVGAPVAGVLPWSPREAGALAGGRWPEGRRARLARAARELAGWAP